MCKLDEFIDIQRDAKKCDPKYRHRPLSLQGVHDLSLLLPPEEYAHETQQENIRYKCRFDLDNEDYADEDAYKSGKDSAEAVLVSVDSDMRSVRQRVSE